MIRRCLEVLYCETFSRCEISFTLSGWWKSRRNMRSRVSSPKAFNAVMQFTPVTRPLYMRREAFFKTLRPRTGAETAV